MTSPVRLLSSHWTTSPFRFRPVQSTGLLVSLVRAVPTLIRCLTALERPTTGQIVVNGIDMTALSGSELRAARRNIGMAFQTPNLLDSRTAAANVGFPLKLAGESKYKVAAEILGTADRCGPRSSVAASYPAQLLRRSAATCWNRAGMATNPPVLLCDEPTSALDASSTKQVMGLLQKLRDESGVTVVIITHEMEVVRDYGDLATLLEHGRVVQSGPIAKVLESPESALAEDLVPRPNIDGVEIPDGKAFLDISLLSSPGTNRGHGPDLVASLGADVAAGRFESIGEVQVGRLAITVPAYHSNAIRGQLERNAILVREWV